MSRLLVFIAIGIVIGTVVVVWAWSSTDVSAVSTMIAFHPRVDISVHIICFGGGDLRLLCDYVVWGLIDPYSAFNPEAQVQHPSSSFRVTHRRTSQPRQVCDSVAENDARCRWRCNDNDASPARSAACKTNRSQYHQHRHRHQFLQCSQLIFAQDISQERFAHPSDT